MKNSSLTPIRNDWAGQPQIAQAIEQFLHSVNPAAARFLTPQMVINSTNLPADAWDAAKQILLYLASERVGLLTLKFAIADDQDNLIEIETKTAKAFLEHHTPIINPETGYAVKDPNNDLIVFFEGTDKLREIDQENSK